MIDKADAKPTTSSPGVILQSFGLPQPSAPCERLDPAIRLSALFGMAQYDTLMGITDSDKTYAHIAKAAGLSSGDFFSPDQSLATPTEVQWAHDHHLLVAPYTVNTTAGWQKMADAKVDAIITDDPAGLLQWLRTQTPPLHP